MKSESRVKRFERAIYQSLVIDPTPQSTIERLRRQIADGEGSEEWRAALTTAITKFEAR